MSRLKTFFFRPYLKHYYNTLIKKILEKFGFAGNSNIQNVLLAVKQMLG